MPRIQLFVTHVTTESSRPQARAYGTDTAHGEKEMRMKKHCVFRPGGRSTSRILVSANHPSSPQMSQQMLIGSRGWRHSLASQGSLSLPVPPNFIMSSQCSHFPQSGLLKHGQGHSISSLTQLFYHPRSGIVMQKCRSKKRLMDF